jgi:hypothetical protein
VWSKLGSGSTFTITLPAAPDLEEGRHERRADRRGRGELPRRPGLHAEREGFEVIWPPTGPRGWPQFDRHGADIVLLDLMMPGLSGTEVCRRLRQRSTVPIIMVTARDAEIDKVVGSSWAPTTT